VIGDAQAAFEQATASHAIPDQDRPGRTVSLYPPPPPGAGRRALTVALAVAVLAVSALGGWMFGAGRRVVVPDVAPPVAAIVTTAIAIGGQTEPAEVRVTLRIINDGPQELWLVGSAPGQAGVSVVALDPRAAQIPPRGSTDVEANTEVDCAKALPLIMPALIIQTPEGQRYRVQVPAADALIQACAGGVRSTLPLTATAQATSGKQLRVTVRSPTGRPTRVVRLRAGGVVLAAHPLPFLVADAAQQILIEPPAACPAAWRNGGIPLDLDLDVEVGVNLSGDLLASGPEPATVRTPLGVPLVNWILDTACAGDGTTT